MVFRPKFFCLMRATCPAHLIVLYFMILTVSEEYKLGSSPLRNCQHPDDKHRQCVFFVCVFTQSELRLSVPYAMLNSPCWDHSTPSWSKAIRHSLGCLFFCTLWTHGTNDDWSYRPRFTLDVWIHFPSAWNLNYFHLSRWKEPSLEDISQSWWI
jgi:hypothetical protein